MVQPKQKPGNSKQDYQTPDDFKKAVVKEFGALTFDLAADSENALCAHYFTKAENSLKQDWIKAIGGGIGWLNPEYGAIGPWAEKCAEFAEQNTKGAILMLVPASVGSNWFAEYVYKKALVLCLRPRLTFKGCAAPYPKDLILCVYGFDPGIELWKWK